MSEGGSVASHLVLVSYEVARCARRPKPMSGTSLRLGAVRFVRGGQSAIAVRDSSPIWLTSSNMTRTR
jgi:hypothetical protein